MPKYEVLKDSYLNLADERSDNGIAPRYCRTGEKVDYDGVPGSSLKPLDAKARDAVEKAKLRKPGDPLKAAQDRIAELEAQLKAPKPDKAA